MKRKGSDLKMENANKSGKMIILLQQRHKAEICILSNPVQSIHAKVVPPCILVKAEYVALAYTATGICDDVAAVVPVQSIMGVS